MNHDRHRLGRDRHGDFVEVDQPSPQLERCPHGSMPREAGDMHWRAWHRGHGCHLDDGRGSESAPIRLIARADDDMKLPEGRRCGECASFNRCVWLVGCQAESTMCDWSPSRFRPRKEQ